MTRSASPVSRRALLRYRWPAWGGACTLGAMLGRWPAACLLAFALVGCAAERRFVGEVHQVALTTSTPALAQSEEGAVYLVETRIELPVRRPPEEVRQDLRDGLQNFDDLPFRRLPWIAIDELAIEIDFVLASLDDEEREVAVVLNGINEFHEYVPGVAVVDDVPTPEFSQWERLYTLAPQERLRRTVREEELREVAVDLATVVNGAPNSHTVVFFENKSGSDPRSDPFIPAVVPGLVGVRLGLRANEAFPVLLEASVRVRDVEGKLADPDDERLMVEPEMFVPVAPAEE